MEHVNKPKIVWKKKKKKKAACPEYLNKNNCVISSSMFTIPPLQRTAVLSVRKAQTVEKRSRGLRPGK